MTHILNMEVSCYCENSMIHSPASKIPRIEKLAEQLLMVKKLSEHATVPIRGSLQAAGYDLARCTSKPSVKICPILSILPSETCILLQCIRLHRPSTGQRACKNRHRHPCACWHVWACRAKVRTCLEELHRHRRWCHRRGVALEWMMRAKQRKAWHAIASCRV